MLEIVDPVYRCIALRQSKNVRAQDTQRLAEHRADDSGVGHDRDGLIPVPRQQRFQCTENALTHLVKVLAIWKLSFRWPRHPELKNIGPLRLYFSEAHALEFAKMNFSE